MWYNFFHCFVAINLPVKTNAMDNNVKQPKTHTNKKLE